MTPGQVNLGFVLVGALALAWKAAQLARCPHDRGLQLVTACIAVAEAEYLLPLPAVAAAVDHTLGAGATRLGQNLTLLWFNLLLVCFFRYSAGRTGPVRRDVLGCAVASAALIALVCATPPPLRATSYSPDLPAVQLRAFYLVSYGYLAYVLAVGSRAAWASARVTTAPLSIGLRVVAVALAGKLVGGPLVRLPTLLAGAAGHTFPAWVDAGATLIVRASIVLFLLGVVFPLVAGRISASTRWWRSRRDHRDLGPLWALLHEAFPQDELRRGRRTSMRGRCYRRAVECRDGLVRLSPHWPPDDTARSAAEQLRSALRAYTRGEAPLGPARLVVPPLATGVEGDVAALVALSRQVAGEPVATTPA